MTEPLVFMLLPLAAYLAGAIPTTLLIGRWRGVDLRTTGTGNIGAGNMTRSVGLFPAMGAAFLDGLKGLVPVLVCRQLDMPPNVAVASGIAAVVGNNWSIFLKGDGGRGLATSVGTVVALAPVLMLWPSGWAVLGWRIGGGLAGFLGWGLLPVFAVVMGQPASVVGGSVALAALMIARRVQGNPGRMTGARSGLARAIWDTDRPPDIESADDVAWP